jgi:hypothetical protein
VFRHEVILRIRSNVPRETIEHTLRQVRGLLREIQGVDAVRTGTNAIPTYRHAMIVVDLKDDVALHRFQRHPLHARAIRMVTRLAESTAVGSYHVASEQRRLTGEG